MLLRSNSSVLWKETIKCKLRDQRIDNNNIFGTLWCDKKIFHSVSKHSTQNV